MAEKDLDSRIELARKVTDATIEQSRTGQTIAAVLAIGAFAGGIVFFGVGNDVAGGVLFGMPVVLLVQAFLRQQFGHREPQKPETGNESP